MDPTIKKEYPHAKVLAKIVLLGPIIGLYFGLLCMALFTPESAMLFSSLKKFAGLHIIALIFGFIPAFLSGAWVIKRELQWGIWQPAIEIFVVSSVISAAYFVIFFNDHHWDKVVGLMLLGLLGGVSSIITARIALPK